MGSVEVLLRAIVLDHARFCSDLKPATAAELNEPPSTAATLHAPPAPDQAKWPSRDIPENRHRSATFKNHACARCRTRIRAEAVFSLELGAALQQQISGVPRGRHQPDSERNQQTSLDAENQPDVDSLSIASRPSYVQLGV